MLECVDLREVNMLSIILRMILAVACAGLIGVERGRKRRPAGFRTHILVCVGATLAMTTNQYMVQCGYDTDASRLGAQVISGIGFLGVGTIVVIGRNQVKGLTTAAGLWVCGCIGLGLGIGFYEGAIIASILVIGVMSGLYRIDEYVQRNSKVINIYIEIETLEALTNLLRYLKQEEVSVSELEIQRSENLSGVQVISALMTLTLCKTCNHELTLGELGKLEGIKYLEEIY